MKRFLRPTGQILTTAVFTSASLNLGYLTARADETRSQPEATASVVETTPSASEASTAASPAAPAVAPPESLPVQSSPAPSTSVVVQTEAPKSTKDAPVANYVVPTEPVASPSPASANATPAPSASEAVADTQASDATAGAPTATAQNENSADAQPAATTTNPATRSTATATGTVKTPSGASASTTAEASSNGVTASATSNNPAKVAKQSFVIESLAAAARRQAQQGNFQQAYLIAQDPLLPRDVQAALQAEIRQLEAAAQSNIASAGSTPQANAANARANATNPSPGNRAVANNQVSQPAETVDAIAETMIASARRQAQAGEFQQAYLIAQDPLLSFDIQQRLQAEIQQLEIAQQPSPAATELNTAAPSTDLAELDDLEDRETAIAETLIVSAQQQAQNGNFAQAYLIAQDPFLPVELQAALQADIQQLEAEAQTATASSAGTLGASAGRPEDETAATETAATETAAIADISDTALSTPALQDDKRSLKQQAIAQNLMRIALDYAAAGDVDAANLIAQDPSLSVEQQQELQRQLTELIVGSANLETPEDAANAELAAEETKPNKVALADAASESATDETAEAATATTEGQIALVPQGSFETFGLNQLNVGHGRSVNGSLSPLPRIAYLNSTYSAAFSCAQPTASSASAPNTDDTQAVASQPDRDAAKSIASRDVSAPLDLSFLNRNGLGNSGYSWATNSRFSLPQATYTAPATLLEADQQPFQYYVAGNATIDPILNLKQLGVSTIGFANPSGSLRYVASDLGKTAIANLNIFDKIVAITQPDAEKTDIAKGKISPAAAAAKALPTPPSGSLGGQGQLVSDRSSAFETFDPNNLSPKTTDCYPIVTSAIGGQVLATPAFGVSGFQFPLSIPAPITSPVGWRIHPISGQHRFHAGTDFGAPTGTPVVAARSGQVAIADYIGGYGATVVLDHADYNQQTLYAHLSQILVPLGTWVEAGTVIGLVGSTGNSTGPHLHFEVRQLTDRGWVAVNPIR
ncbi:MAG: peptidoglycan DD-metalloendopeptidase family protein [Thainema sp.]